jgi:superfamily II DNA/RNA helicase
VCVKPGRGAFAQLESQLLTEFQSFGLAEPIARALAEENHVVPTPIQSQTVPLALTGRDIIGIAQTGTGKTAAFALPILHKLSGDRTPLERKTCRVLVLSPTRELSSQILDSFNAYGRHLGVTTTLAIGGVRMGKQVRAILNGVDVLVATPGRLLDLVESNALRLNRVTCLVLDEADRMLDMGFIHDIRRIVTKLPKERQTLMFSATMPDDIAKLAAELLRNPARVAVAPVASTAERVSQRIVHVNRQDKPTVLAGLLRDEPIDRALVFTRTKHGADKLVRGLGKAGIGAEAIHGNKSQSQRERVLAAFRQGEVRILVATDIAARGIDVEGISHVVNYDLPNEPESYVHRIGRTARAGASGTAISLCDADEMPYLRSIEKLIRMSLPAVSRRGDQVARTAAAAAAPSAPGEPRARRRPARSNRPRNGAPEAEGGPRSGGVPPPSAVKQTPRHKRSAEGAARPNGGGTPSLRGAAAAGPVKSPAAKPAAKSQMAKSQMAKSPAKQPFAKSPTAKPAFAKAPVKYGGDVLAPGHHLGGPSVGPVRRTAQSSPVSRDLSRVAFLNRGIEPRRDSAPQSPIDRSEKAWRRKS